MRFLVSPGFAKSGTTSVFEAIAKDCPEINLPRNKEVDYLRQTSATLAGYLQAYPGHDPQRTFIDISPQYGRFMPEVLDSVSRLLEEHEVGYLFCIREPISRGFSHYLYDLSSNFFVTGLGPNSLLNRDMLARYFAPMLPVITAAATSIPTGRVFGYSLEKNLPTTGLADFLGLPTGWAPHRAIRANRTGYLPALYYDPRRWTELVIGNDVYALPPRAFLFSSGPHSGVWFDFPEDVGERLLANSASWTRRLDVGELQPFLDRVTSDYQRSCDALGLPSSTCPDLLDAAHTPALPAAILAKLQLVGKSDDAPPSSHFSVAKGIEDIERAFVGSSAEDRIEALWRYLAEYGPSPRYLNGYAALLIDRMRFQELISLFDEHPSWVVFLDAKRLMPVLNYRRAEAGQAFYSRIVSALEMRKQKPILPGVPPL